MRIFTERRFKEELERRLHAAEEADYARRKMYELEDKIERLRVEVEKLRYELHTRKEE